MLHRQRLPKQLPVEESPIIKKKVVTGSVDRVTKEIDLTAWELPQKRNQVDDKTISDFVLLIYGEQKIGKTTLASQFGETLFFSFENGTGSIPVYATKPFTDWRQFTFQLDQIEKIISSGEQLKYDYGCIDTGHAAYDRALEWVCLRDGIQHPGKVKDFGASWKAILNEFSLAHNRIIAAGMGLIVISHSRIRERENRFGTKIDRTEPCFSESAELYYKAICDLVGYYHIVNDKRYLLIMPTEDIVAGHRIDRRFLTVNGDPIHRIPLGNTYEEAYENLEIAFNNKQVKQYKLEEIENRNSLKKL